MIQATQLRKGMCIQHDNELFRVVATQHVTPGNWRGMVQAKIRNLRTGAIIEHRFRSEDRVERAILDENEMEYLYQDGDMFHFMNSETFDQVALSAETLGDAVPYLTPNIRLKVDKRNPSYHPIEDAGQNVDVPSLLYPLRETSIIYCSDCHSGSSGSNSFETRGPHGSNWPFLLEKPYSIADGTVESYQEYELCYKCHDRNVILSDGSLGLHKTHVVDENVTCSTCHDPHGISATQGNATHNSHLMNFDISVVAPDPNTGMLMFEDLGSNRGRCYLACHGAVHSPAEY